MARTPYRLVDGKAKIQIEDILGTSPGGGWVYQAPGVGNAGAEGAHYFYRSQTAQGSHKTVPAEGRFAITLEIEQAGVYGLLLRATRDTNDPPDARNDIWIQVDGDTTAVMPAGTPALTEGGEGFVKFKGAWTKWLNATQFSAVEHGAANAASDVVLGVGIHTIVFAPRSTGFHIDSLEVVTRSLAPAPEPTRVSVAVAAGADDFETLDGARNPDLDLGRVDGQANGVGLRFTGLEIAAGTEIESAYLVFTASAAAAAGGSLEIEIQQSPAAQDYVAGRYLNNRNYLDETVAWTDLGAWQQGETYRSADVSALVAALLAGGGLAAEDALAFRITGTGSHAAHAFESGGGAPRLVVNLAGAEPVAVSARIAAGADDFETRHGLSNPDLDLGRVDGQANGVGLRFTGLEVAAGAEIESAYFVFTANAAAAAGGSLEIEIQAGIGARDFASGRYLRDRDWLDDSVTWTPGAWQRGETYRSADVSELIATLLAGGGLEAEDALAFRITGTGTRSAHAFEGSGAAPELVINWLEA
jgi:hypothetical protein